MTNDYKDILLKYLTNNLTEDTPLNDIPTYTDVINDESDVYSQISQVMTEGFVERGVLKCKDVNNNYNGKTIVYGYYYTDSSHTFSHSKGFIVLLDENYKLLDLITQFSSGTDLRTLVCMNIDEKGQVYAIDIDGENRRLILCNNPSIKSDTAEHYQVKLRISYTLQGNVYSFANTTRFIFKDVNSASYYFHTGNGTGTSLKINVGSTNDWQDYTYSQVANTKSYYMITCNAFWDSQNKLTVVDLYKAILQDDSEVISLGISDNTFTIVHTNKGEFKSIFYPTYSSSKVHLLETSLGGIGGRQLRTTSGYIISPTKFYMTTAAFIDGTGALYPDTIEPSTILYDNGTITRMVNDLTRIEAEASEEYVVTFTETQVINNTPFNIYYINVDNTLTYPNYDIYTRLIIDEYQSKTKFIADVQYSDLASFNVIDITNMYNLYKINALVNSYDAGTFLWFNTNIVYNANNYNGASYENTNSLVPKQVWLYDNDNNLIFARNLYNKVLYNNITESILEVPNTMLNNTTISTQKLIGETNYILNVNQEDMTKNVYETLYINFFNTLNMINKNDPNNQIVNLPGATRINHSVSNDEDYDNAKITKFRVNYTNGTSITGNVNSSTITNNIADIQFQFTPISDILNIEIISNDENTIYQTITGEYVIGTTYVLSQKCYVE